MQVVTIPLLIAGKYRDEVSFQSLPLAGQLLGMSQIVCIVVPVTIAVLIDFALKSFLPQLILDICSILILLASIFPIWG